MKDFHRNLGLAALAGLCLALCAPGKPELSALAWIGLLPLLIAVRGASPGRAALLGLISGLTHYLIMLNWITIVLGTYGHLSPPVSLTALVLLSLFMSLYTAAFAAIAAWSMPVLPILWVAPPTWVALDLIRGQLFSGFPWQDLAYSQYRFPKLIQAADLTGHHGITFLIILVNGLLFTLFFQRRRYSARKLLTLTGPAILLILAALAYSMHRYQECAAAISRADTFPVAVIQGNIDQDRKWNRAFRRKTISTYLELSAQALAEKPQSLVIWPETALPFYPFESPLFDRINQQLVNNRGVSLLTGAPHRERYRQNKPDAYFNSAFLLCPQPEEDLESEPLIGGRYDKQHLVPFGEYIPMRSLLPSIAPVVETMGDFSPGHSPVPLTCGPLKIGVLICFESIFPELARQQVAQGAELLTNLTNDAWFGRSNAPWQHLSMVAFRAVETKRSLARAANSGISGFIDPLGRPGPLSPLFTAYHQTADVPILTCRTFFVRHGHHFGLGCLLLLAPGGWLAVRRKKYGTESGETHE